MSSDQSHPYSQNRILYGAKTTGAFPNSSSSLTDSASSTSSVPASNTNTPNNTGGNNSTLSCQNNSNSSPALQNTIYAGDNHSSNIYHSNNNSILANNNNMSYYNHNFNNVMNVHGNSNLNNSNSRILQPSPSVPNFVDRHLPQNFTGPSFFKNPNSRRSSAISQVNSDITDENRHISYNNTTTNDSNNNINHTSSIYNNYNNNNSINSNSNISNYNGYNNSNTSIYNGYNTNNNNNSNVNSRMSYAPITNNTMAEPHAVDHDDHDASMSVIDLYNDDDDFDHSDEDEEIDDEDIDDEASSSVRLQSSIDSKLQRSKEKLESLTSQFNTRNSTPKPRSIGTNTSIQNNYSINTISNINSAENNFSSQTPPTNPNTLTTSNSSTNPSVSHTPSNTPASAIQHYDRYGFKKQTSFINEEQYNEWWNEYSQYCIRRKLKWKLLLKKSGLPVDNDSPSRFPSKSEKLKRYVRKGIPAEWRGNAWWHFARGQEKLNKNKDLYEKLLIKMDNISKLPKDKQPNDWEIIERDLNRTFPDNIDFQKQDFQTDEPPLIKSLRRVLVAFSLYNTKIGYCQSMNFLAGLLLLFLDEERAFWMLVIITSRYLPGVHNVNLEGVNVDQGVLMLCLREYLPEIWELIDNSSSSNNNDNDNPLNNLQKDLAMSTDNVNSPTNNENASNNRLHNRFDRNNNFPVLKDQFLYKLPPITLCTASWFMSCFVGIVPIETTLRIWDCLFYEDSHFLFKISLAIFKLSEPEMLKGRKHKTLYSLSNNHNKQQNSNKSPDDTEMEIFQVVQTFPKTLINPNEIFGKAIFKRRVALNKLNQEEVDRCRKYVTSQRAKFKHFAEIRGEKDNLYNENQNENSHLNTQITDDIINDALSSELYGFKKSLTSVHWNNSIKAKVKQMRKKMED
ncbi:hypothetical protein TBLA_0B08490 [Henningerozyma blattae CBS 6284]|uniref:Rab-GAP TBC domain-containing protein n=1 Tax=Henningerozyma blattae (strain ATCC 34711 / CBS 6284 / DSM 70876 / NBRC 10599 / NRRL Y-10934 / UCD 77-7) TaxID=1071380 RepID=I2GZW2_HENB6|nr:hypothetical protein TBLA_0B08490 [Tetrapisispora blattae CBS 6284]CCH59664.1 hypothetical protein TBLA_0B08490 [Tetrapisispora blattae CBS 6284]